MENYLFTANLVVWLGICGYVALLAGRQRNLERRLKQLETLHDD